jgi:hypothetical protein
VWQSGRNRVCMFRLASSYGVGSEVCRTGQYPASLHQLSLHFQQISGDLWSCSLPALGIDRIPALFSCSKCIPSNLRGKEAHQDDEHTSLLLGYLCTCSHSLSSYTVAQVE